VTTTSGLAIECRALTRSFPSGKALDDVSFELQPGEVLALLGPNGAGKTTTVRVLNGVLAPDSGYSRVLGLDPALDGDAVRRRTGVLTENAGLDDRLTSRENLEFTARIRGFDQAESRRLVNEMLERFGMLDRADDLTQGFSTGQRKRVALARALLHDPEVLFLDEPTSGLDPAGTRDVIHLVKTLADEGRTIVLATHFLGEAGRLADRMAVLHKGRLRAFGRPDDLAADLWDGMAAELDLGGPADADTLAVVHAIDGVLVAEATATGAALRVHDREALAQAVRELVSRSVVVYGALAMPPTLEDVYFELEGRIYAEEGGVVTDGFLDVSQRALDPAERHEAGLSGIDDLPTVRADEDTTEVAR
jgi:ABC-2 type transport system ATP-binding protein